MATFREICEAVGIDAICARIEGGETQGEIAKSLAVDSGDMSRWLNDDPQRCQRARTARTASAEAWVERGLAALVDLPPDGTQAQIAKAKELAAYCRKIAAIRNPREYGDKIDVSGNITHELTVSSLLSGLIVEPLRPACIDYQAAEDAEISPI